MASLVSRVFDVGTGARSRPRSLAAALLVPAGVVAMATMAGEAQASVWRGVRLAAPPVAVPRGRQPRIAPSLAKYNYTTWYHPSQPYVCRGCHREPHRLSAADFCCPDGHNCPILVTTAHFRRGRVPWHHGRWSRYKRRMYYERRSFVWPGLAPASNQC